MDPRPFQPVPAASQKITMTGASVTSGSALFAGGGYRQVRIYNASTVAGWVKFGGSTVTATNTADMPIAPGAIEVVTVPAEGNATYVAAYGASGDIWFTPGSGV